MIDSVKKLVTDDKNFTYIVCIFIIMLSLSSFTLENNNKQEVMLTLTWICATFVLQISTNNLFTSDYHDGILEQIFVQPLSSRLTVAYKIFAHWLLFGLPISVISSIFSFAILGNSVEHSIAVGVSLLFNTLIIKMLTQFENLSLNIYTLLITMLIFVILIVNSTITTHMALKFAVEQD